MAPVQDLLNRIRWDPEFARGEFELGYFDRVEGHVIVVPFREIDFPADNHRMFRLIDAGGRTHRIPLHRVRGIYKNGQLMWHRDSVVKTRSMM